MRLPEQRLRGRRAGVVEHDIGSVVEHLRKTGVAELTCLANDVVGRAIDRRGVKHHEIVADVKADRYARVSERFLPSSDSLRHTRDSSAIFERRSVTTSARLDHGRCRRHPLGCWERVIDLITSAIHSVHHRVLVNAPSDDRLTLYAVVVEVGASDPLPLRGIKRLPDNLLRLRDCVVQQHLRAVPGHG